MISLLLFFSAARAMTLDAAVDAAVTHSPYLRVSDARITEADARVREATALMLPSVSATAAYQWQNEVTFSLEDQFSQIDLPIVIDWSNVEPAVITPGGQLIGMVQASEALVAPGAWFLREAYKGSADLSRADANVDTYTLTGPVIQSWHASARAQALVTEARSALELATGIRATAQSAFDLGVLRADDLVPLDQAVAAARSAVARAEAASRAADAVLAALTGEAGATADAPVVPTELPDLDTLLNRVDRPELAQGDARIDAASRVVKANWGAALPVLGATGSVTKLDPAPYFGDDVNWQVRLGLTVPLVQGGGVRAKVDEAKARVTQAESAKDAIALVARTEVIRAHGNLATALASLTEGEASLTLAKRAVEIGQDRLKEGGGSVLAVDQARAKSVEASLRLVQARADAALAWDMLQYAMGRR